MPQLRILFIIAVATFVSLIAGAVWSASNKDTVVLRGYVYATITGLPVGNCKISVHNYYAPKNGTETTYISTDKNGYYETSVTDCSLLYMRAFKEGYAMERSGALTPEPITEYSFMLEEGIDTEKDFLTRGEVNSNFH